MTEAAAMGRTRDLSPVIPAHRGDLRTTQKGAA
jgi:hypothetical protein